MAFDEPDKKSSEKKKDRESPPTKVRCQHDNAINGSRSNILLPRPL